MGLSRRISIRTKLARPAIAVRSIVTIPLIPLSKLSVGTGPPVWKAVALPVLSIRKAASIVLTAPIIGVELLPLDVGLRRVWRGVRRHLESIGLRLVRSRALKWRSEPIGHGGKIVILVELRAIAFSRRTLLAALRQGLSRLSRGDQAEIMLCVLQVVFCADWIAPRVGVTRELKIFFSNVLCVSTDLDVWAI